MNVRAPRRKSWAPRILFVTLLLALAAGGYYWQRAAATAADAAEVETVEVRRATLDRTVTATGVIRPVVGAEIDVGSRISGIVRRLYVKVGDVVAAGDALALIDPTEFEAEVAQARADLALAEAELALARSTHERAEALARDGVVAAMDLESAGRDVEVGRARVDRERARLDAATTRLGYTEIRAPIPGVIADVTTREGETVAASFAAPTFVTIVDLGRLEVQAYVDETDIGRIFVGQRATFTVDTYPGSELAAEVTAINPRAELENGVVSYVVRLRFEGRDDHVLRQEMTAHVRLAVDRREDVLTLPRRAIRRDAGAGRELVRVSRDGAWVEQTIETGFRTDDRVEIVSGLTEGESVQLNRE